MADMKIDAVKENQSNYMLLSPDSDECFELVISNKRKANKKIMHESQTSFTLKYHAGQIKHVITSI
jgi:hypothetical protein